MSMSKEVRNILVIGETGTGKSSLVNMLVGRNVAETSNKAIGCTFESAPYENGHGDLTYDTTGLNEASKGCVSASSACANLIDLLRSLRTGVSLIIFVIKKGRITDTLVKNYYVFVRGICDGKVPVILAISGVEMDEDEQQWYTENEKYFLENQMKFDDVVCGCFTPEIIGTKTALQAEVRACFQKTQTRMTQAIQNEKYTKNQNFGTFLVWFIAAGGRLWNRIAEYYGWPKVSLIYALEVCLSEKMRLSEMEIYSCLQTLNLLP